MSAEFVKVNPVSIKERVVEAALQYVASCERFGKNSDEATEALTLLDHFSQHLYWLLYPKDEDGSEPELNLEDAERRLKLIKLQHEALLLKRGF